MGAALHLLRLSWRGARTHGRTGGQADGRAGGDFRVGTPHLLPTSDFLFRVSTGQTSRAPIGWAHSGSEGPRRRQRRRRRRRRLATLSRSSWTWRRPHRSHLRAPQPPRGAAVGGPRGPQSQWPQWPGQSALQVREAEAVVPRPPQRPTAASSACALRACGRES